MVLALADTEAPLTQVPSCLWLLPPTSGSWGPYCSPVQGKFGPHLNPVKKQFLAGSWGQTRAGHTERVSLTLEAPPTMLPCPHSISRQDTVGLVSTLRTPPEPAQGLVGRGIVGGNMG